MKIIELKIPLPEIQRKKFSRWLLEQSIKRPQAKDGLLFILQSRYRSMMTESEDAYAKTKPPENVNLEYLGFRMFELFPIEKFEELKKGVNKLCNIDRLNNLAQFDSFFIGMRQATFAGHWLRLGIVHSPGKHFFTLNTLRVMNLPEDVKLVQISLHKVAPSIIAVIFDVFLEPKVSEEFLALQTKKILSEIDITSFCLPIGGFSSSMIGALNTKGKMVNEWFKNLQRCIEIQFLPYFEGLFLKESVFSPKLPSMQVFSLKADLDIYQNFQAFLEQNHLWLRSLGFFPFHKGYIASDKYLFMGMPSENKDDGFPYRIILFEDIAAQSLSLGDTLASKDVFLWRLEYLLNDLVRVLAILENQYIELNKLHQLRETSQRNIDRQKGLKKIDKIFNESQRIFNLSREIKRNNKEFESIKENLINRNNNDLRDVESKEMFLVNVLSQIENLGEKLLENAKYLDEHYAKFMNLMNIKAVYKLQSVTAWLTAGTVLLGVAAIGSNIQSLVHIVNQIFGFAGKAFSSSMNFIIVLLSR